MDILKKFLRSLQLETYLLVVIPIGWIFISSMSHYSLFSLFLEGRQELLLWSFFYNGKTIYFGLVILYLYFYFRLILALAHWISNYVFADTMTKTIEIKNFIMSFIYLLFILGMGNLVLTLFLLHISKFSLPEHIISTSEFYMSLDKEIFKGIPQLWIQQFSKVPLFDYLVIESYCTLCFFLAVVFLGLLLFNKKYFRKFVLAFFIAPFLAMPFWYMLPAVSPDDMYRKNMYSLKSILPIQKQFEETNKSEKLSAFLNFIEQIDTYETRKKHPLISTNPSMHVAWGEIITYYSMILWWPLGFVFIPWLILNIISTVYTMQHYVIDLPCGLICGAIAIIITNSLFKFEKKYYTGIYTPLYFISIIQADMCYLKTKLSAKFLKKN